MNYFEKHLFNQIQIKDNVSENLGIIITIPCFNEPDLIIVLDSIEASDRPGCDVEIIIHVNSSENSSEEILTQNSKTIEAFNQWNKNKFHKYFLLHSPALPEKHAGVGLARKIAMDEAAYRFSKIKTTKTKWENGNGIIVCLDADCTVEANYLTEIEKSFQHNPALAGCSIHFEHPLGGDIFSKDIYDGILNYELFLRYYILALKWCGFPYSFHTIGSSMAVRSDAYMKLGGMNRRKAGEDFYFLHKLFPFGKFISINTTRVMPSPRISDRVPFGTGADISKQLTGGKTEYPTYNFRSFIDLKNFLNRLPEYYLLGRINSETIPDSLKSFLQNENIDATIKEIKSHTATEAAFIKRFYVYFDGFKVLKFIHHCRDYFHKNTEVAQSVDQLLKSMAYRDIPVSKSELLLLLRSIEKENTSRL